jgi:hypothetical protein
VTSQLTGGQKEANGLPTTKSKVYKKILKQIHPHFPFKPKKMFWT